MGHESTIGRPMEILLVEDSLMFARIAIGALRQGQIAHRLTWLTDGEEALNFVYRRDRFSQAPRPDLILLDLSLPSLDGRELLRTIRTDDHYRALPIVVMTASTDEVDQANAEQLDVQGYLIKPLDLVKFIDLLKTLSNYWHRDLLLMDTLATP